MALVRRRWVGLAMLVAALTAMGRPLSEYVAEFNAVDSELYANAISNAAALEFLERNIPKLDCPDAEIERAYYFRWWTYRKHLKRTSDGWVVTEFLPPVGWAGAENTIVCPFGHHMAEGRWLRDTSVLRDYMSFMMRAGTTAGAGSYVSWPARSYLERRAVVGSDDDIAALLPLFVKRYEAWEKGWAFRGYPMRFDRKDGLFHCADNREGMEYSGSGNGARVIVNSAMAAEARAIAQLAREQGDSRLASRFAAKADALARNVREKLWNAEREFFVTRGEDGRLSDVREIQGYAPWYFLEAVGSCFAGGWKLLLDPKGFLGRAGLTTVDRSDPHYKVVYEGHPCQWNGPSWPYVTSMTLTALANAIRSGESGGLGPADYLRLLRQYAAAQSRTLPDGRRISWIDENLDPDTGTWISREILLRRGEKPEERGKDYNHSTFCDLVISGLAGFQARADGSFSVQPMFPKTWDRFALTDIPWRGHCASVLWENGILRVEVDGVCVARRKGLGVLAYRPMPVAAAFAGGGFVREQIDLTGTWQRTEVDRKIKKVPGPFNLQMSVATEEPLPANAVWEPVTVPIDEKWINERRVLYYRRTFELSAEAAGRHVAICFDKPFDRIRVSVNGVEVGDARPWGLAWECDATKAVKQGTNEIVVRLSNERDVVGPCDGMIRAGWEMCCFGMRRGVWVEVRPKLHVKTVRAKTRNSPVPTLVATVELSDGTVKTYAKEFPDAKPWTPDTPNLYTYSLKDLGCDFPDDYSIRVGFRELDWSGRQLKMNGHPFLHRRVTWGNGTCDDPEALRAKIRQFKRRGIVGARVFMVDDVELIARLADEEGFLVTTCAPVGNSADLKSDSFWDECCPAFMREQINQQGNHPSIICWGLGNEFGAPYAAKEETTAKQVCLAEKVAAMDPTRPWCYYGEIEKGNPVRGTGPQPIRSIHYPWGPTGHLMPECSQWAVNGASWHGRWGKDKPMVISEDLYHGMNDQFVGMAKWGGDSIYSAHGCFRACMTAYHWFALGYYRAGVSGWEPWATFAASDANPIYDVFGQPMPDFLFAPKSWHRNFFSGERKTVDFDLFNQTFTPFDGKLVLTTFVDGREVRSRKVPVSIPQGEGRTVSLSLEAPRTDTPVAWTLVADIPGKLHETVEFFVFPRVRLADLGPNVMTNALSRQEGLALAKEVAAGRRVLLLDVPQGGWAPFEIARKGPGTVNFLFKRDLRHLARIPEGALACWRPVGTNRACVATSSYVKPSWTDAEVWLDSGTGNGLCRANVMRLPAGKGFWLLCQLPLLERLETEPAAGWLLKELLSELEAGKADFPKKTVSGDAELLKVFNIPTNPKGEVLYANAVTPKLLSAVRVDGKTLWLSEPTAAFPSDWPVEFVAQTNKEWICRYANRLPGPDAPFVSLSRRIPGLSSEDLFWWKSDSMWPYWQRTEVGGVSMWIRKFALTGAIRVKDGATGVKSFTEPTDAMVAFRYGKGLVFISTLKLSANLQAQAPKVERTVRRIFNFLGARTDDTEMVLPRTWRSDDLVHCNAILYHEKESDPAKVWFGNGDDMRYFPVNQCGWSVAANNKCPVEPWPTGTVPLQGVPFKFRRPGEKKPSPNVCRIAPGDKVSFWGSFHGHEACPRRVWFLGACEKAPTRGCLEVEVPYVTGTNRIDRKTKTTFEYGRHFGAYASVEKLSEGRVAWRGPTKSLRDAALYLWCFDTPPEHAQHRLDAMPIKNTMDVPMVILGITEEY